MILRNILDRYFCTESVCTCLRHVPSHRHLSSQGAPAKSLLGNNFKSKVGLTFKLKWLNLKNLFPLYQVLSVTNIVHTIVIVLPTLFINFFGGAIAKFIEDQEVEHWYWITPPRFSWRPFWTPPMPTLKNADLLTVWSSTGTWSTYSPSSPPSSWSSSTSTPLGWSTTSERFPWRIQNPQNFQSPLFLGAVQRLRPGRRRWDDRTASSGDAWTRATGQNHISQILIRNMHLEL